MKVLVTGATGFVGRHLIARLTAHGHEILAIVRPEGLSACLPPGAAQVPGNMGVPDDYAKVVSDFSPEACVHLAWEGIPDYSADMSLRNLRNSIAFVDFLSNVPSCRRLIMTGSCFEYGRKCGACREEDGAEKVDSYFSWAKHALRQYATLRAGEKGWTFLWFRLFYVYGPGQRPGALIPSLVASLRKGEEPTVNAPANANDFVYVGDVAEGVARALDGRAIRGGIYNLGTGRATAVGEMVRMVKRAMGGATEAGGAAAGGDAEVNFWADTEKTRLTLGWTPSIEPAEGIARYLQAGGGV